MKHDDLVRELLKLSIDEETLEGIHEAQELFDDHGSQIIGKRTKDSKNL